MNGEVLRHNSTSKSRLTYTLPAYTLQPGVSYTVMFTVNTVISQVITGSSHASVSVYINTAPVFAVISGNLKAFACIDKVIMM
jgi:hypothetical protein